MDISGSAVEIIQRVMEAESSQLLVPEKLQSCDLVIPDPLSDQKYIGLFSSGTTGTPKCIWNSYDNLLKNARNSAKAFDVSSEDRLLMLALPWHVAGLSWALMAEQLGCSYTFLTTRKGEAELWADLVHRKKPDHLLTVPGVLRGMYSYEWFVPNVVYGGYPIRFDEYPLLAQKCERMYQGYGQTEAGGLITCHVRNSSDAPHEYEHLNQGVPIQGVKVRCDGSSKVPSAIWLRSETAFTTNWYESGDIGYRKNGDLFVTGRKMHYKNEVISNPKGVEGS